MDTYVNLTNSYVQIGKNSLKKLNGRTYEEIVSSIDCVNEGVSVVFKEMSDEIFRNLTKDIDNPRHYGKEGYIIEIADEITIYYTAEITKLYALYAIKRHYTVDGIGKGIIYNTPKVSFRCFRSYLPGKKNIESFKRFIDMLIAFGHNAVMLEIGGAMEYKRHPEINEGWVEFCKILMEYNGKSEHINKIYKYPKNISHPDNGEGEFLTQDEVCEIVDYCTERCVEIIPEVPSLSHSDYLLYNHPEFAEVPEEPFPNNACPSNEGYQRLVLDVLDEVIEVFKPKRINICHDEVYVLAQCPKCRDKDPRRLLGDDIIRLYNYLEERNIKTMVWSDSIVSTPHGGDASHHQHLEWDGKTYFEAKGEKYKVAGFRWVSPQEWKILSEKSPETEFWFVPEKQCVDFLPKDIEAMNWYWSHDPNVEVELTKRGIFNVFGNFIGTGITDFEERIAKGVEGVSFSNWGKTDFESMQRNNSLFAVGYNSFVSWCEYINSAEREKYIFEVSEKLYKYINYASIMAKHLEIIHTTDAVFEHPFFYDGTYVEREQFRMGEYEVIFSDGSKEVVPIYWGYNIGNSDINWGYEENDQTLAVGEGHYAIDYVFEPIGMSRPIKDGEKTWYKISVPVEKNVVDVVLKVRDDQKIFIKSWGVCPI